jgi:hypothetical protein
MPLPAPVTNTTLSCHRRPIAFFNSYAFGVRPGDFRRSGWVPGSTVDWLATRSTVDWIAPELGEARASAWGFRCKETSHHE